MKKNEKYHSKMFLLAGAVLGLCSGLSWFKIGEIFDNHFSNFIAWFVLPAVLPLLIAIVYTLWKPARTTIITNVVFVTIFYAMHWLPFVSWYLYFILFNLKM